jgi:hypothetical protein
MGDKQQKYIQRNVGSDAVNADLSSTDYTSCVVVPVAKDMGVRRIVVETDSKLVADMWQSRSTNRLEIKPILCDVESRSLNFFSFSLVHVYHEANLTAHARAKEASDFQQNLWMDVTPNFLGRIV